MTRKIIGRLSAAAAIAMLASQGTIRETQAEPLKVRRRLDDYEDQPAECDFVSVNRKSKRGGNGKGRKWWNN